ncbi:anthranilate synthase component I family protein [Thalassolituus sp. LLYu03]|uniref:anthranilate synthase component I family protein n=1 Tax=Thalassolituus sp. LLYu03 TaxID=3421656 RepID=UPI003D2CC4D8
MVWLFPEPSHWQTLRCAENIQTFAEYVRNSRSDFIADAPENENTPQVIPGWAGYFSYEAGRALMGMPHTGLLGEFGFYPMVLRLNLSSGESDAFWLPSLTENDVDARLSHLTSHIEAAKAARYHPVLPSWQAKWDKPAYLSRFQRVHEYLLAGDCYQVNLAMPFDCAGDLRGQTGLPLLEGFRPSFGGIFRGDHSTLFSVSPERFIHVQNGRMETRPIKGTAPRSENAKQDEQNRHWLAGSEKNRAENLMIVDLLRNDMSIYAQTGTVQVPSLFSIESHANVHHMVSTITAKLADNASAVDVVLAALPGGSITGAPKKRSMEIIQELEAASRSAYCGSMGYFGVDGSCDFNILIRTIIATETGATCWGGGGVVMDSDADSEWEEIHNKVGAILRSPI